MNFSTEAQSLTVSVPVIPSVVVFVRHARNCKYFGDETSRRCRCPKHLRWTHGGKQYRQAAKTRSWEQAEEARDKLRSQFAGAAGQPIGGVRVLADSRKTIEQALELFVSDKRNEGVGEDVLKKYSRELERFHAFMEKRGKFFPNEIASEDLTEFRADWEEVYPSTHTRSRVLTRLRAFLRYCYDRQWIERIPKIASIKIEERPTLPFTDCRIWQAFEGHPR